MLYFVTPKTATEMYTEYNQEDELRTYRERAAGKEETE